MNSLLEPPDSHFLNKWQMSKAKESTSFDSHDIFTKSLIFDFVSKVSR
jgi:hypothetical protein